MAYLPKCSIAASNVVVGYTVERGDQSKIAGGDRLFLLHGDHLLKVIQCLHGGIDSDMMASAMTTNQGSSFDFMKLEDSWHSQSCERFLSKFHSLHSVSCISIAPVFAVVKWLLPAGFPPY